MGAGLDDMVLSVLRKQIPSISGEVEVHVLSGGCVEPGPLFKVLPS